MTRVKFLSTLCVMLFAASSLFAAKSLEGVLYYKIGYYQQAQEMLLKDLAAGNGTPSEIYYYLGNIESKYNDNPTKAAEYYTKGLGSNPKKPEVFNSIGLLRLKIKTDLAAAKEGFEKIYKANRKNLLVAVEIGYAFLDNKELDLASEYQGYAYGRNSQYAPAHILWGDYMNALGDGNMAATSYEQAIACDPHAYEAYVKYSRIISHVNLTAAVERLNELKQKAPELSLANKELSEVYYKTGRFEKEAAAAYEEYIKANNYVTEDLKQYAAVLLFANRYEESLTIARRGLVNEPNDPSFSRMVMYSLVELERYDEATVAAEHFFNKTTKPQFSYLDYMYRGRLNDAVQNYDQAASDYLQAIAIDTSKTDIKHFYLMAIQAYEATGKLDKGIAVFEKYMATPYAQLPESKADNLMELGRMYYGLGISRDTLVQQSITRIDALTKAYEIFKQVEPLEPDDYRSYYWQGSAASQLDPRCEKEDAKNAYIKALEICKAKYAETGNEQYQQYIVTCVNFLCFYYYQRYVATDYTDDALKSEMLKYAEELSKLDPGNNTAAQILEVFK